MNNRDVIAGDHMTDQAMQLPAGVGGCARLPGLRLGESRMSYSAESANKRVCISVCVRFPGTSSSVGGTRRPGRWSRVHIHTSANRRSGAQARLDVGEGLDATR